MIFFIHIFDGNCKLLVNSVLRYPTAAVKYMQMADTVKRDIKISNVSHLM